MSYPQVYSQLQHDILDQIDEEILSANRKHGDGPLADQFQVVSILTEELGEFAAAVNQGRIPDAQKELVQVAAVAINWLQRTGPHFSNK